MFSAVPRLFPPRHVPSGAPAAAASGEAASQPRLLIEPVRQLPRSAAPRGRSASEHHWLADLHFAVTATGIVGYEALLQDLEATIRDSATLEGIAFDFYGEAICQGIHGHLLDIEIVARYPFASRSDCPLRQIVAVVKLHGQDAASHAKRRWFRPPSEMCLQNAVQARCSPSP